MHSDEPMELRIKARTLDDPEFPLGIVRTSTEARVTFANRQMRELLGDQIGVGSLVSDLPLSEASRATLTRALVERFDHERGSGYRLQTETKELGTTVRAQVAAVPEYDAQGHLIGSLGFVIDESSEVVAINIFRAMEHASDPDSLLLEMSRHLREVLTFDTIMVTGIGKGRTHLRAIFEHPLPPPTTAPYRWWAMPAFVKAMIEDFEAGSLDVKELFSRPDFAALAESDCAVREFRARGFRHALRLGVVRHQVLVAIVTMFRQSGSGFNDSDLRLCKRLPIVETVSYALDLGGQRQQSFTLDVIESLAEIADNTSLVAQRLVDHLWGHFGWEHVSLFRVTEDGRRMRMICQAQASEKRLPDDYEQSSNTGMLGRCFQTRAGVNVGDLSVLPEGEYVQGIAGMRSELVLPVPGRKLTWVLNVESTLRDAFAQEEQAAVELILRVTGLILERTATLELQFALLNAVADAVIQTNALGVIQDVNPACERLLRYRRDELLHRRLSSFVSLPDEEGAPAEARTGSSQPWAQPPTAVGREETILELLHAKEAWSTEVELLTSHGATVPVLLSAAPLPSEFGGKVFVASDLTQLRHVERMGALTQLFRQLASEIRLPLALAAGFLGDVDERQDADPHELADKALRQIRKADLPLERVLRLAGATETSPLPRNVFELRSALSQIEQELPREGAAALRVSVRGDAVMVRAAYPELVFCLQSLISFLLRIRTEDEHVDIRLGRFQQQAFASISLSNLDAKVQRGWFDSERSRDLALVVPVIEGLARRMGGLYIGPTEDRPRFKLVLAAEE